MEGNSRKGDSSLASLIQRKPTPLPNIQEKLGVRDEKSEREIFTSQIQKKILKLFLVDLLRPNHLQDFFF